MEAQKMKKSYLINIILAIVCVISISRCSSKGSRIDVMDKQVDYLSDTISVYSDKLNRLSTERLMLVGTVDDLKHINKELHKELKIEKAKFITKTEIRYSVDTLYRDKYTKFTIMNDSVLTDVSLSLGSIILGYDGSGRVFAKSTNPSVHIDSLDASLIQPRQKRIGIGPYVGVGVSYGTKGLDITAQVGFGVIFRVKK